MITAWVGSIAFGLASVLYILLIAGLPYGQFAMGGKYKVLPKEMRVACGVSVLIQLIAILILLQTGEVLSIGLPQSIAIGICYFFAAFLLVNTFMNFLSKSKHEKYTMTPLSFITAICFFVTAMNG